MDLTDAVLALAFVGDLSMGRATDHSRRTACLAGLLAAAEGAGPAEQNHARAVALLRWSGCTANASGFAELLGDDIASREAMMAQTLPPLDAHTRSLIVPLAVIHCEISGDVAANLGLPPEVEAGLRHAFERHDGLGSPQGLGADAVPRAAYRVNVASDLEILARAHGREQALKLLQAEAGAKYPADLTMLAIEHGPRWLDDMELMPPRVSDWDLRAGGTQTPPKLTLLADVVELKLPWLAGHSRRVAHLACQCAELIGMEKAERELLQDAALLHGIGRAALPNQLWNTPPDQLSSHQWEQVRLMPYWTSRAARQIPGLGPATELASYAYERLDGSGYFRGVGGAALATSHRVLATAVALQTLVEARPWRPAHTPGEAARMLREEASAGRFDVDITETAIMAASGVAPARPAPSTGTVLSQRELEVLRQISLGASNKEAARTLGISPSTVGTHVESIFRKLDCATRAAATLKALTAGLL